MCLGNIFQQFYNIADSIVAGQFLGVNALAAIGSTGSLIFFVTGWLNGLTSGFSIWVAQWFGAKRLDRMRHYRHVYLCLSVFYCCDDSGSADPERAYPQTDERSPGTDGRYQQVYGDHLCRLACYLRL